MPVGSSDESNNVSGIFRIGALLTSVIVGFIFVSVILKPSYTPIAKVAVPIPQTGEDSISGTELEQGARLARRTIENKETSLTNKYRFQLEFFDDQSTKQGARDAALDIVSDPNIVAVVGHFTSANTRAALPIYQSAGLPVIMPIATKTSITREDNFDVAFRMPPTNEEQAQTIVEFINEHLMLGNTYIIKDNTGYSEDLYNSMEASIRSREMIRIGKKEVRRGIESFDTIISDMSKTDPGSVVYIGYMPEAIYLTRQIRRRDWVTELIGTDGVYGTRYKNAEGAEGSYVTYQVPPDSVLKRREGWSDYVSAFRKNDLAGSPEGWSAWAYDAVGLAHKAIGQSLEISRIARNHIVQRVLSRNNEIGREFTYRGALYDYNFDDNHDNQNGSFWVYKVENGRFSHVSWRQDE